MTKFKIAAIAVLSVCGVGAVWWVGFGPGTRVSGVDVANVELVALGQGVYFRECAACHGRNMEGQTPNWRQRLPDGSFPAPPHDSSGHTWHHPDQILFEITKFGRQQSSGTQRVSTMPAFASKLPDKEIWAVLSFIKSRWPQHIRQRHDALNEQYQARR